MPDMPWHSRTGDEVVAQLRTDRGDGLTEGEASARLAKHGPNELVERAGRGPWRILWEQFTAVMVVVLIAAAIISAALGDLKDAVAILAIVILNAVLGFRQEHKAERAMAALKRLAAPRVRVRRAGRLVEAPSRELVPGDVVVLEAGSIVPADCRVLESASLRVQESALTGESEPVEKSAGAVLGEGTVVADRVNMAYTGTFATYGRGLAVVVETGMRTELGRIASMLQGVMEEETPLRRRLNALGRRLVVIALILVGAIFLEGLLREGSGHLRELFLTAVSMAVAAVPEGLPAVVTIALAIGAQKMLRRRALIRKLPAVETLGCVTVICSDKTGTLTENRMTVMRLAAGGREWAMDALKREDLDSTAAALLAVGALCNDAELTGSEGGAMGDPTETALVVAAARMGIDKRGLEAVMPRVAEVPFDSQRKRMTTVHRLPADADDIGPAHGFLVEWRRSAGPGGHVALTKGAVDQVLPASTRVADAGRVVAMTREMRERILAANDEMARQGIRVLAAAWRPLDAAPERVDASLESDLTFVGLIGMVDPPRAEAKDAVRVCREAGIRPIMITGDHPLTAARVAQELGIDAGGRVVTGVELAVASDAQLAEMVKEASIYARVSPEHKLRIVQALQAQGHIVAMTGDGVNDAPALKKAEIGVAMGVVGTDVAKEASDMVLLDDNFATIVAAVEEGRTIYENVRKFIRYIMSTNAGEIWVMLCAPLLGMPLPLLPLQILWMNLVTDGLPALALGVERGEKDSMKRPPYPPKEGVFARGMGLHIAWVSVLMMVICLSLGYWSWNANPDGDWQTLVFTTLTLSQLGHALAIRSERYSTFQIGFFSNRMLIWAVAATVALQLVLIYSPFMQSVFDTKPLSAWHLALALGLSTAIFWAVEIEKWIFRRRGGDRRG